jgi:hypothetical protein
MLRVEARGNNAIQAKNIALNKGRSIALKLFLDKNKINISNEELSQIPSSALEKCVTIVSIPKEEQFPYYYRAEVNYKNSFVQTLDMIAKYIPKLAHLSPRQIYLLPIFKRNKKCHYENTQWHEAWKIVSKQRKQNKITLLKKNDEISKYLLAGKNYSQIVNALQISSNKIIVVANGEFAFQEDGQIFFETQYRVLTNNADTTQNQQFLFKENETQQYMMQNAAENFMDLVQPRALSKPKADVNP